MLSLTLMLLSRALSAVVRLAVPCCDSSPAEITCTSPGMSSSGMAAPESGEALITTVPRLSGPGRPAAWTVCRGAISMAAAARTAQVPPGAPIPVCL